MNRWQRSVMVGVVAAVFTACGPDQRPEQPCEGPSFNLVVRTETGPLPADTRINVRYGGNQDGEPYVLGETRTPQAVFCVEDATAGGAAPVDEAAEAAAAGAGGAPAVRDDEVQALRCRLYTQGPARLDVTATGYEPIVDQALSFARKTRCEVPIDVPLTPLLDGGL